MKDQKGSILLALVLVLPALIAIATLYIDLTLSTMRVARTDQSRTRAQLATDAGVDAALEQINLDNDWVGSGGQIELQNAGGVRTTYETVVTPIDSDSKEIVSTGRTFRPAAATQPSAVVKVTVNLRSVKTGEFSVVSGVGGLIMENNSKILGGDVFINGDVVMSNSAQIGLTSKPGNIQVAHQNCPNPANATYPRLCAGGENGQPISITNPARIYGSVRANNQTNTTGMSNPGLVASSGVTPQSLPTHNRTQQKANITQTQSTSYYLNCDANNTTRTWPGRLKIVGNVTISKGCNIVLEGDVWITGNLTLQNSAKITVANNISLGGANTVDPRLPTLMVDGQQGINLLNSAILASNSSNVGMQAITYWSRASCSPDCTDVTGVDLRNSRDDTTLKLDNNTEAPNSILYARWTQVNLANGGSIGAVIGQRVRLSNSAAITFGTSVTTGDVYWVIDSYRRTFN
jgi:hypothetical protein